MKLEVPSPDEEMERDDTALAVELWIGIALSVMVVFFGWFLWIEPGRVADEDPYEAIEDPEERDYQRDRDFFAEMVANGTVENHDWRDEPQQAARVFEIGPRQAAEVVCEQYRASPGLDELPSDVSRRLLQRLVRGSGDAPWSCLSDAYWSDELAADSAVTEEVVRLWDEAGEFEEYGSIMATVVDDLLRRRSVPDEESFLEWIEGCALAMDYRAASACQAVLADRADGADGDDILLLTLRQLDKSEGTKAELKPFIDTLTHLARRGQPEPWKILETEELPDYDVDLRLGALFGLCRLMHHPDDEISIEVARSLSKVAGYSFSATMPHMNYRWRSTCRLAFGNPEDPSRRVELLHVAHDDEQGQQVLELGLRGAVERGHCVEEEGLPRWFCGARRWTGGNRTLRNVMGDYFALTSHANWYEIENLPQDWAKSRDGQPRPDQGESAQ